MRLLTFLFLCGVMTLQAFETVPLTWQVGRHSTRDSVPQEWLPAAVPGAVQLDYAVAKGWPPYWYGDNFKDYLWMEDVFWTYRCTFAVPHIPKGQRLYFYSEGIDYQFAVSFNGRIMHEQEGMFTPVRLDLTEFLQKHNELTVTLFPAPKSRPEPADRSQADQCVKPAVSYGWDWHPRLIPLGIWDDTGLAAAHPAQWLEPTLDYELAESLTQAVVSLRLETPVPSLDYIWRLYDPAGRQVFEKSGKTAQSMLHLHGAVSSVELWWPHDHGEPALYASEFFWKQKGKIVAEHRRRLGFRRVRLVMNEGAWNEPSRFPMSRSVPPMQLEINGRRIFAKGSNWVPPEIFPGTLTRRRYEELLDLAVAAHFNLLRLWGGGVINKRAFFDLCDEKGVLLWQDFPLACNDYRGTPHYLGVLEQEARSIIKKLKPHPSPVIWCGGNELFNVWSGMTDQALALRLLNSLCCTLDPQRPFLPTSPLMGVGHGHYLFRDPSTGEEVFQLMQRARCTAYTEFGVPGPSPLELLKSFIPEEQLWPPKPGTAWESHHAFNAWQGDTWLVPSTLTHYFGDANSPEELVAQGQWLQCEGYKCIFEAARRQKPYCAMALNWCYNEPWPTAANNSLINWPATPKPAYYAVQAACRPVLLSAALGRFSWQVGEEFSAQLWLLNDAFAPVEPTTVTVMLIGDEEQVIGRWECPGTEANTNLPGPTVSFRLPNWRCGQMTLVVKAEGREEWSSYYKLLIKTNP